MSQISFVDLLHFQRLLNLPDRNNDWSKGELFYVGPVSGRFGIVDLFGKRSAMIWFDGSNEIKDWISNLQFRFRPDGIHEPVVPFKDEEEQVHWNSHKVHRGFYDLYANTEFTKIVREDFRALIQAHNVSSIYFVGYSQGAAIAQLAARDFVYHYPEYEHRVIPYLFASPRVGNKKYVESFTSHLPKGMRVVNKSDLVTALPFWLWGYRHPYSETYIGNKFRRFGPRLSIPDHYRESYLETLRFLTSKFASYNA